MYSLMNEVSNVLFGSRTFKEIIYTGNTPVKPKNKPTAMPLYKHKLRVKPVLALLTL